MADKINKERFRIMQQLYDSLPKEYKAEPYMTRASDVEFSVNKPGWIFGRKQLLKISFLPNGLLSINMVADSALKKLYYNLVEELNGKLAHHLNAA